MTQEMIEFLVEMPDLSCAFSLCKRSPLASEFATQFVKKIAPILAEKKVEILVATMASG
jgi:hypothetical protein